MSSATVELSEPVVVDPEMVGDLVEERLADRQPQSLRVPIGARQRAAEQRDLARERGCVGTPAGAWNALIEPEEPASAHGRQLIGRRLLLDDDRHRPELLGEGKWQVVDCVIDDVVEVDWLSGAGKRFHPVTIAASRGTPPPSVDWPPGL